MTFQSKFYIFAVFAAVCVVVLYTISSPNQLVVLNSNSNDQRQVNAEFEIIFANDSVPLIQHETSNITNPAWFLVIDNVVTLQRRSLIIGIYPDTLYRFLRGQEGGWRYPCVKLIIICIRASLANSASTKPALSNMSLYCIFEDGSRSPALMYMNVRPDIFLHEDLQYLECELSTTAERLYRQSGYLKSLLYEAQSSTYLAKLHSANIFARVNRRLLTLCMAPLDRLPSNLAEWIEYHRLVGFEHFVMYQCTPDSVDISFQSNVTVDHYVRHGVLTLINWCPYNVEREYRRMQNSAIIDCLYPRYTHFILLVSYRTLDTTQWVGFIDPDEYFFPSQSQTLLPLLEKYSQTQTGGLQFRNMFMGPCNVTDRNMSKLLIEQFTKRPLDDEGIYRTKMIHQVKYAGVPSVHGSSSSSVVLLNTTEGRHNHYYCSLSNREHKLRKLEWEVFDDTAVKRYAQKIKERIKDVPH